MLMKEQRMDINRDSARQQYEVEGHPRAGSPQRE
jgi:hypothetical protein